MKLNRPILFLIGLALTAGLSTACSNSDSGSITAAAEQKVAPVADTLTPGESSLIASAEAETIPTGAQETP